MRAKLTYANVIATLALCLALGGGVAYGAAQLAKNSVGAKQLKRNAVTAAKVKDGSLLAKDFKVGQLPAGERGPQGTPGATSVVVRFGSEGKPKQHEDGGSYARCLPGEAVVGGGWDFVEDEGPESLEYAVIVDRPSLQTESEGEEEFPAPANGTAPSGWLVVMENDTDSTFYFTTYALCARP